jgi:hypothetical protein
MTTIDDLEGDSCPIFTAKPMTAQYCSKACNQAAYVERRTRAWKLLQIVEGNGSE